MIYEHKIQHKDLLAIYQLNYWLVRLRGTAIAEMNKTAHKLYIRMENPGKHPLSSAHLLRLAELMKMAQQFAKENGMKDDII